ncbi:MAG TPA: hypothetical protein VGM67_16905 [Gemmatimonadaceae bacterium]|jgi:hypothetical protein
MSARDARAQTAQQWNDSLSLDLVNRATARRALQLADTALSDYQATAHGYVTFLAQLGEGLRTPPKIVKADELELEVYWHAPNQSKQRIIGRRDTLLLPTDIAYHMDHLGIVQNNFPNVIRIGDGDEIRDVPHPLSALGLREYDFAVTDSFSIGTGSQRVRVREIDVRPKDDRQPRVVGAIYIDASEGQVVRMNLSFTRAAFIDQSLEELSVVLENRLVDGLFWLPSHQDIEIKRSGTWLDFPARGIIRGRWEIGEYKLNIGVPRATFIGPEIVQVPAQQLAQYPWTGHVLDSLPSDVRMVMDEDIQRVQEEARALVRAQALARAEHARVSARSISDIAHYNRVEGLALGTGVSKQLGAGVAGMVRARYGIDDHDAFGAATLSWERPSGVGVHLFGVRDFRDAGDEPERSGAVNSLAAQEFGSDYTDPYLVRGAGVGLDLPTVLSFRWQLDGAIERQDSLAVHAQPVIHDFASALPADGRRLWRVSLAGDRAPGLWFGGTELTAHADVRATWDRDPTVDAFGSTTSMRTLRAAFSAELERPVGADRFVSHTTAAALWASGPEPSQELIRLGGPVTAPGYDYHSLIGRAAVGERVEWQFPVPFPSFSLGRFGRVPGSAALAPFAHAALVQQPALGGSATRVYPSVGVGFLAPFNLVRLDVARGLATGGRWTFGVDMSREFWSIF